MKVISNLIPWSIRYNTRLNDVQWNILRGVKFVTILASSIILGVSLVVACIHVLNSVIS